MSNTIGEINYNQKTAQKCAVRETTEKSINSLFQRNIITKDEKDNLLQKYLRGEVTFGDDGLTAEEALNFTRENLDEINEQSQVIFQTGGAKTLYIVQAGDTPEVIAKKLGLSGEEAKNFARKVKAQAINDGVYYRYGFQAGDIIVLPGNFQDKIDKMSENNEYAKSTKDINEDYTQKRKAKNTESEIDSQNTTVEEPKVQPKVQPKTQIKDKVIAKGSNGYYVTKDKDGNFHYFNSKGKECNEDEFKKYCPSIHKSIVDYKRAQASKKAGRPFVKHRNTADIKADATSIANDLFLEIDGLGSDSNKTKALLKKITPENVAFVVEAYKTAKGSVTKLRIKRHKENSSHESLAKALNSEYGIDIYDIKSSICKDLVEQAKKIGLKGIYHSAYMKINNVDELDKWIENIATKIRTEMKRTDTKAIEAVDKNATGKEKIDSPAYKEAGVVKIITKRNNKGEVTESKFYYKDGKVVREYTDPKRGRVRELLKTPNTKKTEPLKIKTPIGIKISLPSEASKEERIFAKALEDNKAILMKELGLDNDSYDRLAKLAIALGKPETDFGHKGNIVSKAKYSFGYGLETMANNKAPIMSANMQDCAAYAQVIKGIRDWSYGPTQIKYELYNRDEWCKNKFKKLGLKNGGDLYNMTNAAKAAMVILKYASDFIQERPRYLQGMQAAEGAVVTEPGWEMKNGHLKKTGHTKSYVNHVTMEDAICYLWNGRGAEIKDGTMTPESLPYTRTVRQYMDKIEIEDVNKADRSKAIQKAKDAKIMRNFKPMDNNGPIGSVAFMPKMYNYTNLKDQSDELAVLKNSLSKNNKIDSNSKKLLLLAVEHGEIGFEFGLTPKEADSLTQKDVDMILEHLSKLKKTINAKDSSINFEDGINSTETNTMRSKYLNTIRNAEFAFKKEYLSSKSPKLSANSVSNNEILRTPMNNGMTQARGTRRGFQGKVTDGGVNTTNTSQASVALAKSAQATARRMNSAGKCMTGFRDAMLNAGVTAANNKDLVEGSPKGTVGWFERHPDMFEEVKYIQSGSSARQINSTDLPNLPAGYIVVWIPDNKFKSEPGHISITNGNGQAYADETDNLDWGVFNDKKNSGKGEHGTIRVFRLTNKWKVENGKLKFEG